MLRYCCYATAVTTATTSSPCICRIVSVAALTRIADEHLSNRTFRYFSLIYATISTLPYLRCRIYATATLSTVSVAALPRIADECLSNRTSRYFRRSTLPLPGLRYRYLVYATATLSSSVSSSTRCFQCSNSKGCREPSSYWPELFLVPLLPAQGYSMWWPRQRRWSMCVHEGKIQRQSRRNAVGGRFDAEKDRQTKRDQKNEGQGKKSQDSGGLV